MNFDIVELLLTAIAVLISLTVHEYCHGYAAHLMGDDTAKNFGRLTLNPIKHIDPIGALCMLFFHIGWAKPVPINARNFKDPKKGFAITALAGPVSNLALGFFTAFFYLLTIALFWEKAYFAGGFIYHLTDNTIMFLGIFFTVNVGLGLFNLIPIPPFDGSRLLNVVLPPKYYFGIMKYERYIYYGVLAWLLLGDYVTYFLRGIPAIASSPVLNFAVGIFDLSGMIGTAIGFVTGLMLDFWQLIPFLRIF